MLQSGFLAPTTPSGGIKTAADNAVPIAIAVGRIAVTGAVAIAITWVAVAGAIAIAIAISRVTVTVAVGGVAVTVPVV